MGITSEQLKAEELRLRYIEMLEDPNIFPTRANWDYIIENAMPGLGELLYKKYLMAYDIEDVDRAELHVVAIEEFPKYLCAVDRDYALEIVYNAVADSEATADLIERCRLFDADYLCNLIDCGELKLVFKVLMVYQPDYQPEHLAAMRRLAHRLHSLPQLGQIEERRGVFGSARRYICPNGHANDINVEFCTHSNCGLNTYGITADQMRRIKAFDHRITALTNLLG